MNPYGLPLDPMNINLGGMGAPGQVPLQDINLKARRGVPGTSQPQQPFTTDVNVGSRSRMDRAQAMVQDALGRTKAAMGQAAAQVGPALDKLPAGRIALGAGLLSGVPEAISELQQGRVAGAAGALGGGVGLGLIGAGVSRIPHPLAKVAGAAIPIVGGLLGAPAGAATTTEAVRQGITKKPTKGKEGEYETERARALQTAEDQLSLLDRTLGVNTSNIRDLSRLYSDQVFLDAQRMNPLIQKMKNADMVRQQALINTQAQNYAMLGTIATAGKLATGAQAETGATLRQALASNPYANAVLSAPSISFG